MYVMKTLLVDLQL